MSKEKKGRGRRFSCWGTSNEETVCFSDRTSHAESKRYKKIRTDK